MTTHILKGASKNPPARLDGIFYEALRKIVSCQAAFLMVLFTVLATVSVSHAAPGDAVQMFDCSEKTLSEALWHYTSGRYRPVLNVQLQLEAMGYDPKRDDGIIGPDTLAALKAYCEEVNRGDAGPLFGEMLEKIFDAYAASAMDSLGVEYVISQDAITTLRAQSEVIKLLEGLKGQTFPSPAEFQAAIMPQLAALTAQADRYFKVIAARLVPLSSVSEPQAGDASEATAATAPPAIATTSAYGLAGGAMPAIVDELELTAIPDGLLTKLEALVGIEYPNAVLLEHGVRTVLKEATDRYFPVIAAAAKVVHDPQQANDVELSGADCGCTRDFNGVVYGFHPFWFGATPGAGGATDTEGSAPAQAIDFSIMTRLGYFAASLDQDGNLGGPAMMDDKSALNRLTSLAHHYKSKVDVVIFHDDWSFWPGLSAKRKDIFFNNLRKNIIALLDTRSDLFWDRTIPYISFGTHPPLTLGDGVTLYLDGYPGDNVHFFEFVKRLRADLDALGQRNAVGHYFLNLMLDMDALGEGVYAFDVLQGIVPDDESMTEDYVDLFIMHLPAPTTDTKKALRNKVEKGFKGMQRRNMLRKIIPVITPIGHQQDSRGPYQQFFDDLVYFQDNFAGIGFWPLPSDRHQGLEQVKTRLIEVFEKSHQPDMLERLVTTVAPNFCEFACPNRWALRVIVDIIIACLAIYALLSLRMCRLKKFYRRHLLYFLLAGLAVVGIVLISFVCDPYWKAKADDVAFVIVLLVAISFVLNYVRKTMQGPLP